MELVKWLSFRKAEGFLGRKKVMVGGNKMELQIETHKLRWILFSLTLQLLEPDRTARLIKKGKGPRRNSKNGSMDAEPRVNIFSVTSLADKLEHMVEGSSLLCGDGGSESSFVKPKDITTAVTAEVVISGHKRIPSRTSIPVQRTIKGMQVSGLPQLVLSKRPQSSSQLLH
ncbi:hypothetical protein L211DRAFT_259824 [Terfezia boudieri ATCC MYA-4762]|uniref:Uncharacterized protein n=1 Tax=Terfezia boudieri ATCC MYA-4762 TaxID=1051890 RepID=A0A3N4M5T4_9PEZI|nr:hypothetical protein L211DRAFT_259824 [Terfezia boudieri ATCC MYA-4762]